MPKPPIFRHQKIDFLSPAETDKSKTYWYDRVVDVDTSGIPYRCDRRVRDFTRIDYKNKYLWALRSFARDRPPVEQIAFFLQYLGIKATVIECDRFRIGQTPLPSKLRDRHYQEIFIGLDPVQIANIHLVRSRIIEAARVATSHHQIEIDYLFNLGCEVLQSADTESLSIPFDLSGIDFKNKEIWELFVESAGLSVGDRFAYVLSGLGINFEAVKSCDGVKIGQTPLPAQMLNRDFPIAIQLPDSTTLTDELYDRLQTVGSIVAGFRELIVVFSQFFVGRSRLSGILGNISEFCPEFDDIVYPNRDIWQLKATALATYSDRVDIVDFMLSESGFTGYTVIECSGMKIGDPLPGYLIDPETYPYIYVLFDTSVDLSAIEPNIRSICQIAIPWKRFAIGYSVTVIGSSTLPSILNPDGTAVADACPSL